MWNINNIKGIGDNIMLKPYKRQQIQTDKILDSIYDTHVRDILKRILTNKDTLYNIIYNEGCCTSLEDIVTNTNRVVIVVDDDEESFMLDKNGGDLLGVSEDDFVGTGTFPVYSGVLYIIETNYKNRQDVYARLPCIQTKIRGNKHA